MSQIVVNGKTYASLDDLPPEIREVYKKAMGILADNDHNGVPDILESKSDGNTPIIQSTQIQIDPPQFIADGKVYSSAASLPLDKRQKLAQALARLDPLIKDVNGIDHPDIFKGETTAPAEKSKPDESMVFQETTNDILQNQPSSVMSEERPNYRLIASIILAGLVIVGLLGASVYLVLPLLK
jgi:hypothetical protein